MTWSASSFAQGYCQCHRLCEQTLGHTITSNSLISVFYTFNSIDPGTYCIVGLNETYSK